MSTPRSKESPGSAALCDWLDMTAGRLLVKQGKRRMRAMGLRKRVVGEAPTRAGHAGQRGAWRVFEGTVLNFGRSGRHHINMSN